MARLTDKQREGILNQFHIGTSQHNIADMFKVSPATVNKLCKGLEPRLRTEVNAQLDINTKLFGESEQQVNAFNEKVNELTRKANLVYKAQEKAIKKMEEMMEKNIVYEKIGLGGGVEMFKERPLNTRDMVNIVEGIDKASITLGINQRHATTNITNNNLNAQQANSTNEINITQENMLAFAKDLDESIET